MVNKTAMQVIKDRERRPDEVTLMGFRKRIAEWMNTYQIDTLDFIVAFRHDVPGELKILGVADTRNKLKFIQRKLFVYINSNRDYSDEELNKKLIQECVVEYNKLSLDAKRKQLIADGHWTVIVTPMEDQEKCYLAYTVGLAGRINTEIICVGPLAAETLHGVINTLAEHVLEFGVDSQPEHLISTTSGEDARHNLRKVSLAEAANKYCYLIKEEYPNIDLDAQAIVLELPDNNWNLPGEYGYDLDYGYFPIDFTDWEDDEAEAELDDLMNDDDVIH